MAWTTQNDSNGVSHNVWMQERGASCGPSCCMMVVRLILQRTLTSESSVLSLLDSTERHAWEQLGQVQGRSSWERATVFCNVNLASTGKAKSVERVHSQNGSVASLCKRATLKRLQSWPFAGEEGRALYGLSWAARNEQHRVS